MKTKRHHNNTGHRQIKNGATRKFANYLKRKYTGVVMKINLQLEFHAEDGCDCEDKFFTITSADVPGLCLAGKSDNPEKVLNDIPAAIITLWRLNKMEGICPFTE